MKYLSTALLVVAFILLPIAIWAEQADSKVWYNRLAIPEFEPGPNRHTPRHADGTILPPIIRKNLRLTLNDNPVLLTATTRIIPGVTVTADPGTDFYAYEFAQLIVEGTLSLSGTPTNPITLTSNEVHPLNQTWGGIVITNTGQANITHTKFRYGSPAITCLPSSHTVVTDTLIEIGSLGLFTASRTCSITNSTIRGVRDGVTAIGVEPQVTNTIITASHSDIVKKDETTVY